MVESESNQERAFKVESGVVAIIDQYMLGNDQLLQMLRGIDFSTLDNGGKEQLQAALKKFGGCVVSVPVGELALVREPYEAYMILLPVPSSGPSDEENFGNRIDPVSHTQETVDLILDARPTAEANDKVYIDTRCVVFVDAAQLGDRKLLSQYRALRKRAMDKKARDLLREHGALVRYGFNTLGDELDVVHFPQSKAYGLWPSQGTAEAN